MIDDMDSESQDFFSEKGDENETGSNLPSTAEQAPRSSRLDQLIIPMSERGKMPLTKDKYIIRENPHLVTWERELRKFLRQLSPSSGHRVSAPMVYEWATGLKLADLLKQGENPSGDLRHLNRLLKEYFGSSYQTWIAGRKVGKCYRVPEGHYITRKKPKTITLWAEYEEGTLEA